MTLSDLEWRNAKGHTFPDDLRNYAPTIFSKSDHIRSDNTMGKGRASSWSDTPHPEGTGHKVLKNFGLPTENLS